MDRKSVVDNIIKLVGSEANINTVSHCFTRLRFRLKDRKIVNDEELKKIEAVYGVYDRGGEIQIVMGNEVSSYYEIAAKILGDKAQGSVDEYIDDDSKKEKMSVVDWIADLSSSIFIPIIGVLGACGTFQGVTSFLLFLNLITPESGTYLVFNAIGHGIFYFLPFYLAYTTAQKFGGKPFLGMTVAASIMYPDIISGASGEVSYTFLQLPLMLRDYSSTVFPVVVAVIFAAFVEKQLRKIVPDILKMIFVPMLTLLIVVPLTLLLIGPALTYVMEGLTAGISFLYARVPIITGSLIGGIWQLLVFTGVSKAFIPIFASDFASQGYTNIGAVTFFVAAMGQTGAVFAIAAKTRKSEIKSAAIGAGVSGLFGITEPALFGLNVPAKRPFIIGSISAAIGGFILAFFDGKLFSFATGLFGIPSLINPETGLDLSFWAAILSSILTFVLAFIGTYQFGWKDKK